MGIFRFTFVVFALVAMASLAASLFGGAASTGFAALGALMVLPILFFKGVFLLMIFGFFGRMAFGHRHRDRDSWRRPAASNDASPSPDQQFEDWHRMAHAREEVESWTPEL